MMINFIGLKIMNSQFIEIMRVGEIGQKNAREKSGRKLKELNNIPSLNYPSILLSLYLISYFLLLTSYFLLLTSIFSPSRTNRSEFWRRRLLLQDQQRARQPKLSYMLSLDRKSVV